jgi:hypothetical protein
MPFTAAASRRPSSLNVPDHGGHRGTGTTINRFRLNELASQVAFGG